MNHDGLRPRVRDRLAVVCSAGGVVVVVIAMMLHTGVPGADLVQYALYLLLGLIGPGLLVHRLLRGPSETWLSELAYGACTGVAMELVAWAVFVRLGWGTALWLWPLSVWVLLGLPSVRRRALVRPTDRLGAGWSVAVAAATVTLVYRVYRTFFSQQFLPGSGRPIYPDLLWHMGLVNEARRHVPLGTPQVIGSGTLHYHWFSDAQMAAATLVSQVGVPVEVMRLFPMTFTLLTVAVTVAATHELSGHGWAGGLAGVVVAAGSTVRPFPFLYGGITTYQLLSPSQMFAAPLTIFVIVAVTRVARAYDDRSARGGQKRVPGGWGLLALAAIAILGAKASAAPSLLGGVEFAWLWGMVAKRHRVLWSGLLAGSLVVTAVALTQFAGGDAGSTKQLFYELSASGAYHALISNSPAQGPVLPGLVAHPFVGLGLVAYQALTLCLLLLAVAVLLTRHGRRHVDAWLIAGTILAATLAFIVIRHQGGSEFYFVMGVLPVAAVGATVAGSRVVEGMARPTMWRRRVVFAVAAIAAVIFLITYPMSESRIRGAHSWHTWVYVSLVVLLVLVVILVAFGRRMHRVGVAAYLVGFVMAAGITASGVIGNLAARRAEPPRVNALVLAEQRVGSWIDTHLPQNAVLATNQHCLGKEADVCASRQWWVSGIGGRSVLVEGWSYTPQSANREPFVNLPLLRINQAAYTEGTPGALAALARHDVSYLVAVRGTSPIAPAFWRNTHTLYVDGPVAVVALPESRS